MQKKEQGIGQRIIWKSSTKSYRKVTKDKGPNEIRESMKIKRVW